MAASTQLPQSIARSTAEGMQPFASKQAPSRHQPLHRGRLTGFLPPSSRTHGVRCLAAPDMMTRPTVGLPRDTSGLCRHCHILPYHHMSRPQSRPRGLVRPRQAFVMPGCITPCHALSRTGEEDDVPLLLEQGLGGGRVTGLVGSQHVHNPDNT